MKTSRSIIQLAIILACLIACKKDAETEEIKPTLPEEAVFDLSDFDFVPSLSREPNSGGFAFYDDKGNYYSLAFQRRNKGSENATVVFSTDDLINPATSKIAQADIQETIAYTHNNPLTVTVTFNDTATVLETLGAKKVTLHARDTTKAQLYVRFKWIEDEMLADIHKAAAAFKNVIALTNDIEPNVPGIQPTPFKVTITKLR